MARAPRKHLNIIMQETTLDYLKLMSWVNNTSSTQYVNDLIARDMEANKDLVDNIARECRKYWKKKNSAETYDPAEFNESLEKLIKDLRKD